MAACFHEADPSVPLPRRAAAEGLGTLILVFSASASGLAATRLLPGQPGAAVVLVAFGVSGALVSLIIAFGKLSGGHYNPLITIMQLLAGERSPACTLAYVILQIIGGIAGGAVAANLWDAPSLGAGGLARDGFASEFVASAGLMLVVFGSARSDRPESGPFAVGAWLTAAVIGTPTASYANPAVVLGATVTAGPVALGRASVVPYITAEFAGALLAIVIVSIMFPKKDAVP